MSSTLTQSNTTDAVADVATGVPVLAEAASMASTATVPPTSDQNEDEIPIPDVSHLVTEDDTPVDNLIQEKLQRFLVECLYSSLKRGIPFLAAADVGIFYGLNQENSIAPDVLLSLGVSVPEDWSEQRKRSYFIWEFGKPPDVVIEIVSNKKGGELASKLQDYARIGVPYYVVFDPLEKLSPEILQIYGLHEGCYQRLQENWLKSLELGLTVWEGEFETKQYNRWLRWCDSAGNLLLTGNEQAQQERQRVQQTEQQLKQAEQQLEQTGQQLEQTEQQLEQTGQQLEQAEQQLKQAEQQLQQERQRAERLAALLRAQNINPDL